jgi:hypothetical protein
VTVTRFAVVRQDAPARVFDEEHLARAVLGRLPSLPAQPAGTRRADRPQGVPSTVLLPVSVQRVAWDGAGLARRVVLGSRYVGTLRFANRGDRTWVDSATLGGLLIR